MLALPTTVSMVEVLSAFIYQEIYALSNGFLAKLECSQSPARTSGEYEFLFRHLDSTKISITVAQ